MPTAITRPSSASKVPSSACAGDPTEPTSPLLPPPSRPAPATFTGTAKSPKPAQDLSATSSLPATTAVPTPGSSATDPPATAGAQMRTETKSRTRSGERSTVRFSSSVNKVVTYYLLRIFFSPLVYTCVPLNSTSSMTESHVMHIQCSGQQNFETHCEIYYLFLVVI